MSQRRGPKAKRIWAALQAMLDATGGDEKVTDVWYEPINGPCIEMQGYAGGWYYTSDEGGEDALGYNFAEAMEMVRLKGELRKAETLT